MDRNAALFFCDACVRYALPSQSMAAHRFTLLLRCLDSLSVADTVHIIAGPFPSIALQCRATPGLALL
jgi:hypothetical protein